MATELIAVLLDALRSQLLKGFQLARADEELRAFERGSTSVAAFESLPTSDRVQREPCDLASAIRA